MSNHFPLLEKIIILSLVIVNENMKEKKTNTNIPWIRGMLAVHIR